ncbi:heterokaryon incompatibility protein (HET) domain-containing protein [Pochonia chlamydosporia 170]|uniref:Heterokaryon incompatibility protein (HET) domain-containing protein n=1 Tax=Pochonia chlamydosporia 170 TaxID=1380566 RepID=A0A179FXB8_METCM|nr:heterokaryon incompatibility protein (HET) domain-containing protein [Pochonia chlamydosporia 170]OAQ69830.1 heterokaryon incompatibility protein (HET) domain-containing protein [Pochonia chlamydosporia 170]
MTDNSHSESKELDEVTRLVGTYGGIREALNSGSLSLEQEVRLRSDIVDLLIKDSDQSGLYDYLQDAIQHLETILRRLPRDSPERAVHLSKMSYVQMSEHVATNSRHALDEAVSNGRQAKELGVTHNLLQSRPDVYINVMKNFGFALSQRYAITLQANDLEEAIACAKEIYDHAPKDSAEYYMNLNNFASRLRMQYSESQNPDDINEAMRLIRELQSRTASGSREHGFAAAQLGVIGADKFKQTKELQDLDEALGYCKAGLDSLPATHELRIQILRVITNLYDSRYKSTSEEGDLRGHVQYSERLLRAIPPGNNARGKYLVEYMRGLHKLAERLKSLEQFRRNIRQLKSLLLDMPSNYPEKPGCHSVLADFYLSQYDLSRDLQDLMACVGAVREAVLDYNEVARESGSPQSTIQASWPWDLGISLGKLFQAPRDNPMRKAAERGLPEELNHCRQLQSSAPSALEQFYQQSGPRLKVLSKSLDAGRALSSDEIENEIRKLKEEKGATVSNRRPYKTSDYVNELGARKLAMDESKNIILDLSGIMGSILGIDRDKTYTREELCALHAEMEQKAIDNARSEGRHPNLRLCRMCRDEVKILQPVQDGFELAAKRAWLPFGNYFQLLDRSNCSICSLMLSAITTKSSGALHPRLAAIDPEVQGIRLTSGQLSTKEKLIRFDYGMKAAGELRLLTSQNYSQALRQGWQVSAHSSPAEILANQNGPIYDASGQQINPNLVKSWLRDCDNNHRSACNHPRLGKRADAVISLILINVQDECLVSSSSDAKYFALSYVWGQVDMSKTFKSNYSDRLKAHSLAAICFPKTIQDAMAFVRSLDERYLWVDALCIVQDDDIQMARDIPNMDIIYSQAFATIVALSGTDANSGLPGVSPGTREPQKVATVTISNKSPALDDDPHSNDKEIVGLVATPRQLYLEIELSRWSARSWIVQEHLLSRRCLFFAPDALYFQCGQSTLSEGGANEEYVALMLDKLRGTDNDLLNKANRNNPLSSLTELHDMSLRERMSKTFNAYAKLVEIYSRRNLTYKSDILKAFAGIFAVLEEYFESAAVHGLPSAVISHALLWTPIARLPRRGSQLPTSRSASTTPNSQFPTWSWVGWDGPVEYRVFEMSNGKIALPTTSVKAYYQSNNDPIIEPTWEQNQLHEHIKQESHIPDQQGVPVGKTDRDGDKTQRRQVIAKMVPDLVRGSTWFIGAAQTPQNRQDSYIETKLLRFTARTVALPAFGVSSRKEYLSYQSQVHNRSPQAVRRILDRKGKHCGLWWEQAGYGYVGLDMSPDSEANIDLLEISRYGPMHCHRDGPSLVEGPISMFDKDEYPEFGSGSGLVNILAVDLDMGLPDGIGERCTVAVIHSAAWEAASPQEKEVRMV